MRDRYDLQRFVDAQQPVYGRVTDELRAGDKRSHWMRFIFPQIKGIGSSPTAQRYAISGLDEVRDYLDHPVLGPRLRECTAIVNDIEGKTLDEIFGYPDNLKFCSSMTLFAGAAQDSALFKAALRKHCGDEADPLTRARLVDG
ncbi:MAG: NTP pyrophosphohydrolases including oxidative damage repair enzymes [uncultured Paraburkholderia sp.]|uniref:DUF1810 domain-containing protein n=1 Tax=uncultured Paraburkholderia sp. TaxID=1822466 RepID=UPI002592D1C8|nr:DUF1810 domain-containing protein [uncultured Paraburkholderia sp.]CAH2904516.1 MAG: NTP pyrophosphohydrolases including oxidative damage repair enzymes [uncultured Paraburkholderia sp.]CAH2938730.1 MAG: NTP pyrophosphohydrolases including oxidative damage repair enzymes [uncultured Paraburkholderia sp.]